MLWYAEWMFPILPIRLKVPPKLQLRLVPHPNIVINFSEEGVPVSFYSPTPTPPTPTPTIIPTPTSTPIHTRTPTLTSTPTLTLTPNPSHTRSHLIGDKPASTPSSGESLVCAHTHTPTPMVTSTAPSQTPAPTSTRTTISAHAPEGVNRHYLSGKFHSWMFSGSESRSSSSSLCSSSYLGSYLCYNHNSYSNTHYHYISDSSSDS